MVCVESPISEPVLGRLLPIGHSLQVDMEVMEAFRER